MSVSPNVEALVKAALLLFVAVDPLGNAPIFYSVTAIMEPGRRRKVILRSIEVATLLLVVFALAGDVFLAYFGLTVADFRIAGGIVLLLYGVAGIMGFTEAGALRVEDEESLAVVPLATPLLAGPAAIATVLYIKAVYGLLYALAAIAFVSATMLVFLLNSEALLRLLGRSGAVALARIMSMIVAAIAVAMIREGIMEALHSAAQPQLNR